ncbi:MAG: hypothetical protein Q4D04_04090 [Clostridia bacterium]|nr:hypothetical protein [Clostridia bacterium]
MKRITAVIVIIAAVTFCASAMCDELTTSLAALISSELTASLTPTSDAWASFMLSQNVAVTDVSDTTATAGVMAWNPGGTNETGEMTLEGIVENVFTPVTGSITYSVDELGDLSVFGVDAFRRNIVTAASRAKSAFDSPRVRIAIAAQLFPEVYAQQGGYTSAFRKFCSQYLYMFPQYVLEAALLTQRPTIMSVEEGPRALKMSLERVNTNIMSRNAYLAAYESLKNVDKANAYTREQLQSILSNSFVQSAADLTDEYFTVDGEMYIDMNRILTNDLTTQSFTDYARLLQSAFEEKLNTLEIAVRYLPDYPVRNQPESGVIKGPVSGTHVVFKAPDDGYGRIVTLKNPETGEGVLSVFMRSGASIDAYIPSGKYQLEYAKGDEWYGDIKRFGEDAAYASSIVTIEILNSDKYHVISFDPDGAYGNDSVKIPMKSNEYVEP